MRQRLSANRNAVALVAAQLASAAGSLLLLLATARALGPSGRGVFAFALLWPTLGAYVLGLGIAASNLRAAARDASTTPSLLHHTILVTCATGTLLAVWIALGLPNWLTGPLDPKIVWIAAACTVVMALFNGVTWIHMGLGNYIFPSLLKGILPGAAAVLVAILWYAGILTVPAALASYLAMLCVVTISASLGLLRSHGRPLLNAALLKSSVRFGLVYQTALIAQLATYRADQWVIGLAKSPSMLGQYSVAVSISEIATYVSLAQGMLHFRAAARAEQGRPADTVRRTLLLALVSAVLVGLAAAALIPVFLGSTYAEAVGLTMILLPGTLGLALFRVCGNELAGRGQPGVVSALSVVQAGVMIAAYVILIPQFGAVAAAIISSVGYCVGGAILALLAHRFGSSVLPEALLTTLKRSATRVVH